MSDKKLTQSKSGATSRSKSVDFTLVPKEAIEAIANRFQYGIDHGHARENWKIGKNDPDFIKERLNHAQKHFLSILDKSANAEDLEALLCNLAMVCWWKRNGNGLKELMPNLYE